MTTELQNRVFTFYSYKGGVGRTFALANCAYLLAKWGFRVVCLDWDLEAPGLHFYFRREVDQSRRGIVDWILEGENEDVPHLQDLSLLPESDEPSSGRLSLVTAGKDCAHDQYFDRLHSIHWERAYQEQNLGARIERMRTALLHDFDFVLLDSRTGISDIGGICGIHLPDVVVAVLTASEQSIAGTLEVTRRMSASRANLVYERSALKILPVLSRFDSREEYDWASRWKSKVYESMMPLYRPWLDQAVWPEAMLDFTTIPYVSRWTFGEELAARFERLPSPEHITYSLENLASLLANGLQDSLTATKNRPSYLNAARDKGAKRSQPGNLRSIFLSYNSQTQSQYAEELRRKLTNLGFEVVGTHDSEINPGQSWMRTIEQEISKSEAVVALLDSSFSSSQERELDLAVRRIFTERSGQLLLPVATDEVDSKTIPPYLTSLQWMNFRGRDPWEMADRVVERLNLNEPQTFK